MPPKKQILFNKRWTEKVLVLIEEPREFIPYTWWVETKAD